MASSGTIKGAVKNRSQYFSFYIEWSATQNTSGGYSDVTAVAKWSTTNKSYTFDTVGSRDAWIEINGVKSNVSKVFDCNPWPSNGTYTVISKTVRVYHNSDGSKSINISAYADGSASEYGPGASNANGTVILNSLRVGNIYLNTGGAWKKGEAYVNINGAWKKGEAYINVNGTWKKSI